MNDKGDNIDQMMQWTELKQVYECTKLFFGSAVDVSLRFIKDALHLSPAQSCLCSAESYPESARSFSQGIRVRCLNSEV